MKNLIRHACKIGVPRFAAVALLLSVGLMGLGCESATKAKDNFDSRLTCGDYCAKNFGCATHEPTSDETDTCVSNCRKSIEDNCGNEHQAAANDKVDECIDKGCAEFRVCMVFEAAPGCFGFVN